MKLKNMEVIMKIIKNKKISIAETIQSSTNTLPLTIHTRRLRLIRLITNEPVPQQISYAGNIKLM